MNLRLPKLLTIVMSGMVCAASTAMAGPIQVGGTYEVDNINFPNTFTSRALTIDQTTKAIGGSTSGGLTVTERITATSSSAEWIEWVFEKPAGPLADSTTSAWKAEVINVPVTSNVIYDGFFVYWTIDGVAAQNITTINGLGAPTVNPINSSLGLVYGGFFPGQGPIAGPLHFDLVLTNYGLGMSQGNMNVNEINGFVMGAHLSTAVSTTMVPEPSTFALLAIGGVALAGFGYRRKRRAV